MGQRAYDQYLERRYRETKESIDFFSDQNKAEREHEAEDRHFRIIARAGGVPPIEEFD